MKDEKGQKPKVFSFVYFVSFVFKYLSASDRRKCGDHITFFKRRVHIHGQAVQYDHALIIERDIKAGDGFIDRRPIGDVQFHYTMLRFGRQGITVIGDQLDMDHHSWILAQNRFLPEICHGFPFVVK